MQYIGQWVALLLLLSGSTHMLGMGRMATSPDAPVKVALQGVCERSLTHRLSHVHLGAGSS